MHTKTIFFAATLVTAALLLSPASSFAADNWIEVKSQHFTVSSNAGEKEARRIANQFEEIRSVFQTAFTSLTVDFAKPFVIIAVKNEDSLKILMPDYYVTKDRTSLAGVYTSGFDRNFAVLRTDVSGTGENPYHSLYHEYTHGIMRLNFPAMPTWLDEGLAEFYGNTVVDGGEIGIGRISKMQLTTLQRNPLIPIQTLMTVDHRSPLYNERDRVSIFYAESWVLVHYLMLDADARKNQLLVHFLKALQDTNDSEEAARQAFGDLQKFSDKLSNYAHQVGFYYQKMKPETHFSDKDYASRPLSHAEALTVQADFLYHTGHGHDAKSMLKDALQEQPTLGAAYAVLGMFDYQQHDTDIAESELQQAVKLDPTEFRADYYLAQIVYRRSGYGESSTPQIIDYLQKCVQINPNFASAHAFLSVAYRQKKDTRDKALQEAMQAAKLDQMQLAYAADVGEALIALDRIKDAHFVRDKMTKRATTPFDKNIAENFAKRLTRYEEWKTKNPGKDAGTVMVAEKPATTESADDAASESSEKPTVSPGASGAPSPPAPVINVEDGVIREAHCDAAPAASMKFAILGDTLLLSAPDVLQISYRLSGQDSTLAANPCTGWSNRKARITYRSKLDKKSTGEIMSIEFQ